MRPRGARRAWFFLQEIGGGTILTIALLKQKAKTSLVFVPELELRRDSRQKKPDAEIDLSVVLDGKVYLGECTKADRLAETTERERKELERLRNLALAIRVQGVVLSTLAERWQDATLRGIGDILGTTGLDVRIFTGTDLRP